MHCDNNPFLGVLSHIAKLLFCSGVKDLAAQESAALALVPSDARPDHLIRYPCLQNHESYLEHDARLKSFETL
jgi:hypothetical protein